MSISFLHCSDLHLGFSQFGLEERFLDFGRAFQDLARVAQEKQVHYLLIAGDFFNKRTINSRTLSQAVQVFAELKKTGIKVIAIEGNHDKAPYGEGDSWMHFLHEQGLIYLLQPEFTEGKLVLNEQCLLEFPGIRFVGLGYLGSMTARRLQELQELLPPSEKFTVLLLHAAIDQLLHLGGVEREALVGLEELVDYVALGHIHGRYELEDWIYNPGAPESWDLGEVGKEKGYYHVVITPDGKTVEHLPSSPRPIYNLEVDLSSLTSPLEVADLCLENLESQWNPAKQGAMVRLELIGEVPFNPLSIIQTELVEALQNSFPLIHVEVFNRATLEGERVIELTSSQFNRQQIESVVLEDLMRRNFAAYDVEDPEFVEAGVEVAQALKELSVAGDQEGMLSLIKTWTKKWGRGEVGHANSPIETD